MRSRLLGGHPLGRIGARAAFPGSRSWRARPSSPTVRITSSQAATPESNHQVGAPSRSQVTVTSPR